MGLVDYSDSDSSDNEQAAEVKSASQSTKSSFQKVVDRSNPGKIRVSLPTPTAKDATTNGDEPPAKRVKTTPGAFSGFSSFLPPPKKTGAAAPKSLGGGATGNGRSGGLSAGVSLKTGTAPAFSRNAEPEFENGGDHNDYAGSISDGGNMSLPPSKASLEPVQKPAEEVKMVGKPLMFKPLSVSRKPPKKKKPVDATKTTPAPSSQAASTAPEPAKPPPPRVSLFSVSNDTDDYTAPTSKGEYQPLIYGAKPDAEPEEHLENPYNGDQYNDYANDTYSAPPPATHAAPPPGPSTSQSLDNIASDLQLSAAERRQLFGRQGSRNLTASKVINFNTDEEYRHNTELRAAGEQVVHNPIRALGPGKHSLKQLVNAAASQKEALEESFAKGYANRKEASGRYGW